MDGCKFISITFSLTNMVKTIKKTIKLWHFEKFLHALSGLTYLKLYVKVCFLESCDQNYRKTLKDVLLSSPITESI